MNKYQVKGAARQIKGNVEAAAGKLIGDAKLRADGKMDRVLGAAYRAFGDAKAAGRKGVGGKGAFKTVSGLKY
ncbi:CsbD family protein [Methyloferula stellata]|uniref:CsbD family protein n=1 Tax=Methyloferula stellata TaxID=876270 RepID=UPI00037E0930|nr:CsbD family protein [Methyloferula stellata]